MIRKSVNKNVLKVALEIAAENFYDIHLAETGKKIHPDRAGDHRLAWMDEKLNHWIAEAEKRTG